MKFRNFLVITLLVSFGCGSEPKTLTKETRVDEEMTIPQIVYLITDETKATSLNHKVIQTDGYLENFHVVNEDYNTHLGKYRVSLKVNTGFGAEVDCYFLDSLQNINENEIVKIKGVMFKEGAYIGLKNCAVMK